MDVIRLAPSSDLTALIHVNHHTAPFYLGWRLATHCYHEACEEVMAAFNLYRTIVPKFPLHFLLSEGSKHWIRDDRISGALLWSYNLNLLAEVVAITRCEQLHVECDASAEFLQECSNRFSLHLIGCQTNQAVHHSEGWIWRSRIGLRSLINSLRQDISNTKRIYANVYCRRLNTQFTSTTLTDRPLERSPKQHSSDPKPTVFLGIQGFTTHRFGDLARVLENSSMLIPFYPHENLDSSVQEAASFPSVYRLIDCKTFMLCIVQSLYLLRVQSFSLWRLRKRFPSFAQFFKQEYKDLLLVCLHLLGLRQTFSFRRPAVVITQGSFNGPHTKRILYAAYISNVKSILIEQKVVLHNQFAYQVAADDSISGMPDIYIIAHHASQNTIASWGVDSTKIKVGYRGPTLNVEKTNLDTNQYLIEQECQRIVSERGNAHCLLILLSDSEKVNLNILNYILNLEVENFILLIREHPNVPLSSQSTVLAALDLLSWFNCSSWPWSILKSFDLVIAIAAHSSAGLEAIAYGAVLIWIPFCTDLSVTYASMINSVGAICATEDELRDIVASLEDFDVYISVRNSQLAKLREMNLSPSGDLITCTNESINELLSKAARF
jgi:hypothetical protein